MVQKNLNEQEFIEVYEDADGKIRWHFQNRNGDILADSGQGYVHMNDAIHGIERVCNGRFSEGMLARTTHEISFRVPGGMEPVLEMIQVRIL